MNLFSVKNLNKKYPAFELKEVSFNVKQGSIMGFIGKNGAGKSTTLKAMLNMVHPDSGTIEMLGKDFNQNEAWCKQNIGVVLGGIDYYPKKKLKTITKVTSRFYEKWDDEKYQQALKLFELDERKTVDQLSAGMRVKYLIALALSHHARLLIFDEPTSGLDPVSRDDLLVLFEKLVQSGDRSILFSTHITSDLEKCADTITYIKDGAILASEDREAFVRHFQYLKDNESDPELALEDIMVHMERKKYDESIAL